MENFTNCTPANSGEDSSSDYYEGSENDILVYRYFFERQIISSVFFTAAVLGAVGNSFVVVAVALSKKLRTTTNVFVVNLAICDMVTCLFMPWQAVAILGGDDWPIPNARWICAMAGFVIVITFGGSVNSLALIAVNRWVGITKSRFTTRRIYTTRKLALMVIFCWTIPICSALTPVLTDFGELGYEKLYSTCTWDRSNPYSFYYNMLITVLYYPIQLTVIVVCYASIFCYVFKTSRKMTRADAPSISEKVSGGGANRAMRRKLWKRQLDVTKNLLYIVLAFILCLTPYFTAIIVSADWTYRLTPWAGMILFGNSCVNPFIYATSHPDFKEAFGHMIRCRKIPRGGSSQRYKSTVPSSSQVNPGYTTEDTQKL
ncbi:octopamine receptor 1-like [Patiria miniata]|uniref:G-protein coupled receptors family 1 profile domain-containing protein n=1 Tax=Patiria miniata TaxID=46514 RepID=A0A913Z0P8_PATMI|nr:octopamine receptor 1-like [Patiria miniata]